MHNKVQKRFQKLKFMPSCIFDIDGKIHLQKTVRVLIVIRSVSDVC